jgi:hypothetical protein
MHRVRAGDVLVAVVDVRANMGMKINPSVDWSLERRDHVDATMSKAIYVRVATAAEPSSYVFDFSRSSTANGIVLAFTGVDTKNPVAASAAQGSKESTSISAPSVSVPQSGAYLVATFGTACKTTITPPSGMREQVDFTQPTGDQYLTSAVATQVVPAGPTGTKIASAKNAAKNLGQAIILQAK